MVDGLPWLSFETYVLGSCDCGYSLYGARLIGTTYTKNMTLTGFRANLAQLIDHYMDCSLLMECDSILNVEAT